MNSRQSVLPVCFIYLFYFWISSSSGTFLPNLSERCYRCLCYVATRCDVASECSNGRCGPFNLSKMYWTEAGKAILPQDDPERINAWSDCARDYRCAKRIVEGYLEKYGKDCNGDGVTNCFDYMLLNGNGAYGCGLPLNRTANGRTWLQRYEECRLQS